MEDRCSKCGKSLSGPEMFKAFRCSKCNKEFCGDCAGWGTGFEHHLRCPDCHKDKNE